MDKLQFSKDFGKMLKQQREALSISQSELAKNCFKDRQYIHRIEKGEISPTLYNVYCICKELNLDINLLLPDYLI